MSAVVIKQLQIIRAAAGSSKRSDSGPGGGVETLERSDTRTRTPKLFKVVLLNDDYTTMEFVVEILESVFEKQPAEAMQIMLKVHRQGRGVCGIYPRQIAEGKQLLVSQRARKEGFPLRCVVEEA